MQRSDASPKLLIDVLNQHKHTAELLTKIAEFNQLNNYFKVLLDDNLRPHCNVSYVENGILHIMVNNAVWATRLRFLGSDILNKLRQHKKWSNLINIKISINNY